MLRIKMDVDKCHVDLSLIEEYLRNKIYPNKVVGKGDSEFSEGV